MQREISLRIGRREDLHLVEMQAVFARHAEADETRRLALQVNDQRFLVQAAKAARDAVKTDS